MAKVGFKKDDFHFLENKHTTRRKLAGYWSSKQNQRLFLYQMSKDLGFQSMEDWYGINVQMIMEKGGRTLLGRYGNSPMKAVMSIFDDHTWNRSKFAIRLPRGYWNDLNNQRSFLNKLGHQLGIKEMEDWYNTTAEEITNRKGHSLLVNKYSRVPYFMLKTVFPEHTWMSWKFKKERYFWNLKEERIEFIKWLGNQLLVKRMEDWYRVSSHQIKRFSSGAIFVQYTLPNLLLETYSNHLWDISKLQPRRIMKASQRYLAARVQELFPNAELHEDYVNHSLQWSWKRSITLDVFLPREKLAFEYQGEQHYFDIHSIGSLMENVKQRDIEKKRACEDKGITLIEIPYWWDHQKESLIATIHHFRQDLIPNPGIGQMIDTSINNTKDQKKFIGLKQL